MIEPIASVAFGSASGRPRPSRVGVLDVRRGQLARELLARHAALAGGVVDLVVHVGDVDHELRVVALVLEKALQEREDDVRPRVADVDAAVDRRAAGVDADPPAVARLDGDDLAAERVVDAQLAHAREATARGCPQESGGLTVRPAQLRFELGGEARAESRPRRGGPRASRRSACRRRSCRRAPRRRLAGEVPLAAERIDPRQAEQRSDRSEALPLPRRAPAAPRSSG